MRGAHRLPTRGSGPGPSWSPSVRIFVTHQHRTEFAARRDESLIVTSFFPSPPFPLLRSSLGPRQIMHLGLWRDAWGAQRSAKSDARCATRLGSAFPVRV